MAVRCCLAVCLILCAGCRGYAPNGSPNLFGRFTIPPPATASTASNDLDMYQGPASRGSFGQAESGGAWQDPNDNADNSRTQWVASDDYVDEASDDGYSRGRGEKYVSVDEDGSRRNPIRTASAFDDEGEVSQAGYDGEIRVADPEEPARRRVSPGRRSGSRFSARSQDEVTADSDADVEVPVAETQDRYSGEDETLIEGAATAVAEDDDVDDAQAYTSDAGVGATIYADDSETSASAESEPASRFSASSSFRTLKGRLEYSESAQAWVLHYQPRNATPDELGGSVVLADSEELDEFTSGQYVIARGKLDDADAEHPVYLVSRLDPQAE